MKVKILDQENFTMKNCLENDEATPKYLEQNKKRVSILDIITLLQNQPNDTGQYFYWVAGTTTKQSNTGSHKTFKASGHFPDSKTSKHD